MAKISEIENLLTYTIKNNQALIKSGKSKITYNIEGKAGIGKTELMEQLAQKLGYQFVKVNLAQTEEVGDILGVPVKEYKVVLEDKTLWVNDKSIDAALKAGYRQTPHVRMGYAAPSWVPKDNTPTIIVFDDYNRTTPIIMQAIMEIISRNEYISWKLPTETQLFLTSNPEDGDYNVTVTDLAQRSRYITIKADFNIEDWAKWAEEKELKSELINFALFYKELFDNEGINARNFTMFCNSIQGLNLKEDLDLITTIAQGAFGEESGNSIIAMLHSFITTKKHMIISPEEMIQLPWETCYAKMKESIYEGDNFRADIAAILTLRFKNYISTYFQKSNNKEDKKKSEKMNTRILDFITSDTTLLTEDLIFILIRDLCTNYRARCQKLLDNPIVMSKLFS